MAQIDSVGHAFKAIRRRALLVTAILLLGTLASVWYAMSKQPRYEAISSVQIEMPRIAMTPGPGSASPIENRIRLIEQKLLSRETLLEVADRHALFRPEDGFSDTRRMELMREAIYIQRLTDPAQSWRTDLPPTGMRFIVDLPDPWIAAAVANDLLDVVMREGRTRATTRADSTLGFFLSEEARVREAIAQVEAQIAQLKSDHAGSLPEAAEARTDRLAMLREAQLELEQQIIGFETGRDRLRDDEARRQGALLEQQALLLADRIAEVQALIDNAPEVERQLNMLERNRTRLQDEFTIVTTRRAEAAMTQVLESSEQSERFEVLETALVPDGPISTSRRELVISGALLSLIAALALALALEWASPYLRTSAQIERTLGVRPVVVIPDLRIARARRLT